MHQNDALLIIMRTTVNLPESLLHEVHQQAGTATRSAAIVVAMEEYVARRRTLAAFAALRGRVQFEGDPLASRRQVPQASTLVDGTIKNR